MKVVLVICSFALTGMYCHAQSSLVDIYRIVSSNTSFPDTARGKGHLYNKVLYDSAKHYNDSSVMIIVPKKLNAQKNVDLIFWFHGWFNNIDSAVVRYELVKQLVASNVNAVLVLAETAKDAPDSYGGKLENSGFFHHLVNDVMQTLKTAQAIPAKCKPGNIVLAGHSGAYRVMAHILQNGNMPVRETILFDALYGETDKYLRWINADTSHRFVNIYTDGGGTDKESKLMSSTLMKQSASADSVEEKYLTPYLLQSKRIVFIHSLHKHNDVINRPDNLELFLRNTTFLKFVKQKK